MQTLIMVQNQPENPQSKPRGKKLGKSLKVWEMLLYENGTVFGQVDGHKLKMRNQCVKLN